MSANRSPGVDRGGIKQLFSGLPKHQFSSILIDPPWYFRSYSSDVSNRDPRQHYGVMSIDRIAALPISEYAAADAHLFLWATGPMLPQAIDVMWAWGFRYSGMAFVWIKLRKSYSPRLLRVVTDVERLLHVGLGHTTRKNAEYVLLGRRGHPKRLARDVREVIMTPRREHSRKPEQVRERIERYCPGPYLELFGRDKRRGWTVRGNQISLFSYR